MKKTNLLSRVSLISGIIILLIGIVHNAFAPVIYEQASRDVGDKAIAFVSFFVLVGAAVIFFGIFLIYSSRGLKRGEFWAWNISLLSSLFIALMGIPIILFLKINFLHVIMLAGAILNLIVLLSYRRVLLNVNT